MRSIDDRLGRGINVRDCHGFSKPDATANHLDDRRDVSPSCVQEISRKFLAASGSPFHRQVVFASARGAIAVCAMIQYALGSFSIGVITSPNLQSRLLDGACE